VGQQTACLRWASLYSMELCLCNTGMWSKSVRGARRRRGHGQRRSAGEQSRQRTLGGKSGKVFGLSGLKPMTVSCMAQQGCKHCLISSAYHLCVYWSV
jgi:hypothetical protein